MSGLTPHQEAKLDRVLEGLAAMVPQVGNNRSDIIHLRSVQQKHALKLERQDEKIKQVEEDQDGLGKKVRAHMGDTLIHAGRRWHDIREHWKFILFVIAGFIGIFSFIWNTAPR